MACWQGGITVPYGTGPIPNLAQLQTSARPTHTLLPAQMHLLSCSWPEWPLSKQTTVDTQAQLKIPAYRGTPNVEPGNWPHTEIKTQAGKDPEPLASAMVTTHGVISCEPASACLASLPGYWPMDPLAMCYRTISNKTRGGGTLNRRASVALPSGGRHRTESGVGAPGRVYGKSGPGLGW